MYYRLFLDWATFAPRRFAPRQMLQDICSNWTNAPWLGHLPQRQTPKTIYDRSLLRFFRMFKVHRHSYDKSGILAWFLCYILVNFVYIHEHLFSFLVIYVFLNVELKRLTCVILKLYTPALTNWIVARLYFYHLFRKIKTQQRKNSNKTRLK